MKDYLYITIAVFLLAADFACQRLYQQKNGDSVRRIMTLNLFSALFTILIFFLLNGCKMEFTPFSLLMAGAMALLCLVYSLIGFRIMREGSMALYTLSLMAGGMTVPYLFGLIFLQEEVRPLRVIGLIVILVAVVLSNSGNIKANRKQILLCAAVFFLNGGCSIVSKVHQIETELPIVSATAFVLLNACFRVVFSAVTLPCSPKKSEKQPFSWKILLLIAVSSALASGLSYRFQLIGASTLPASVLYPFITGGSILLSSLAGILFFREKPKKQVIAAIFLCFIGTLLFL